MSSSAAIDLSSGGETVNYQSGASYTIQDSDRGKLVVFTNATNVAVTLPQATSVSSYSTAWWVEVQYTGGTAATITPTTSTIDGAASIQVNPNCGCRIVSDGTNYTTCRGMGSVVTVSTSTGLSGGPITTAGTLTLNLPGLSSSDAALTDSVAGSFSASNGLLLLSRMAGLVNPYLNTFRLSAVSQTPVPSADQTSVGTLYLTPIHGLADGTAKGHLGIWDGTRWTLNEFTEINLSLTLSSGSVYDVFCYLNSGTPTLETLVWTGTTSRATALTSKDGVLVKSGGGTATQRRYVGTIFATGANVTEDSTANRAIYNVENKVHRSMRAVFPSNTTWAYTTATLRAANNLTTAGTYSFNVVTGDPNGSDMVHVFHSVMGGNSTAADAGAVGIGIDSTTVDSSQAGWLSPSTVAANQFPMTARYDGTPGVGKHNFQALEIATAAGTFTWNKSNGAVSSVQNESGMTAWALI